MDKTIFNEEKTHLKQTLNEISRELRDIDTRFARGIEAADEASEESLRQMLERRYRGLKLVEDNPYFARIDFTETDKNTEKIYLGKTTVYDGEKNIIAADWRAPVANLYYDCRLGDAAYDCPEGHIEGELSLKRRLEVRGGRLISYDDIDITASDEMLAPYLSVSADTRLKNIIATIQSEQNGIIRANMTKPLIVQGAAGSGKTTVALHRIAYLVYTYSKSFRPEHFMVLSSGGFFLSYIAGVLPDLGVEDVPQLSFEELARHFVKDSFRVADPSERLYTGGDSKRETHLRNTEYKSSRLIFDDIDDFVEQITPRFLPAEGFALGSEMAVPKAALDRIILTENPRLPVYERVLQVRLKLESITGGSSDGKRAARSFVNKIAKPKITVLYHEFLASLPKDRLTGTLPQKGFLEYEDLTPLVYLHKKIYGARDTKVRHIVIDEAQDFSPLQLSLLRDIYEKAAFTILGDLAQGIYKGRNVTNWQDINREVWNGEANIAVLDKSYRTTVEIMEAAGRVLSRIPGVPDARAVIRRGDEARFIGVKNQTERTQQVSEFIKQRLNEKHRNIAVIMRDADGVRLIAKKLTGLLNCRINVINGRETSYEGGVCVIPAALAKGLEFDAVVLGDAENYRIENDETNLLYVAMTRAMHALDVIFTGDMPELLQ